MKKSDLSWSVVRLLPQTGEIDLLDDDGLLVVAEFLEDMQREIDYIRAVLTQKLGMAMYEIEREAADITEAWDDYRNSLGESPSYETEA